MKQAIYYLNKAIELCPRCSGAYNSRGYCYLRLGTYDRALRDFNTAIEQNPKDKEILAGSYCNRAVVYTELKDYQRAIRDFSKAINLEPRTARFYHGRAKAKRDNNDDWEAIIYDFERACKLGDGFACCETSAGYYALYLDELMYGKDDFADDYLKKAKFFLERAENLGADEKECKKLFGKFAK